MIKSLKPYKRRNNRLLKMKTVINLKACKETGQFLKNERERMNISRASLSNKTKISVSVIEAFENAWINQFPENAYLNTMLRILENELKLEPKILNNLIPNKSTKRIKNSNGFLITSTQTLFSRFGISLLYIICILSSIFFLNKYYLYLSKSNVQTINPITIKNINSSNIKQKE